MSVTVLIADDQHLVRSRLQAHTVRQPDICVVGEAANGHQAVTMAAELNPDVVLMDIRMPELDGIEATRRIVGSSPLSRTRVLMLTTFDLDEYVYDALRARRGAFC